MIERFESIEKFVRDFNHKVFDYTKNGKCIRCGNCCSDILPLSTAEIKAIAKYKKKHHLKDTSKRDDVQINMVCPFLDIENKVCTIYEVRPLICRDFICNKTMPEIEAAKEYMYATRKAVFMREQFFK